MPGPPPTARRAWTALDIAGRWPAETLAAAQAVGELWQERGALGVLEYEAGRAAVLSRQFGEAIAERGARAPEGLVSQYGRFTRQVEAFYRLERDEETRRASSARSALDWIQYADSDADDKAHYHKHTPDVAALAEALAALPLAARRALAAALLGGDGGAVAAEAGADAP